MMTFSLNISDLSKKYIEELEYIQNSLDYLHDALDDAIDEKLKRCQAYEEMDSTLSMIPGLEFLDNEEEKIEFIKSEKAEYSYELKSISLTILEAILVRQVAIIEKYLVDLSFLIFDKLTEGSRIIVPPNVYQKYNESRDKFTDCIIAVDCIRHNSEISIKEINHWKLFKKLRELRHKLAHGYNEIFLNNDEIKAYNNTLDRIIFEKNSNNLYQLKPSYSLLKEINEYLEEFIKTIDNKFKGKKSND